MIIQCDQCQSKFKLDDSKIPDEGAKVKCSKCKHIFTVKKEAAGEEKPVATVAPPEEKTPAPVPEKPAVNAEKTSAAASQDVDITWGDLEGDVASGSEGGDEDFGAGLEGGDDDFGAGLEGGDDDFGAGLGDADEAPSFDLGGGGDEAPSFDLGGGGDAASSFDLGGGSDETPSFGFGEEGAGGASTDEEQGADFGGLELDTGSEDSLDVEEAETAAPEMKEERRYEPPAPEEGAYGEGRADQVEKAAGKEAVKSGSALSSKVLLLLLILSIAGGGFYIFNSSTPVVIGGFDLQKSLKDLVGKIGLFDSSKGGHIEIPEATLKGYYLQTERDGYVFVIEGKAVNGYGGPRAFIKLSGNLYDGDGNKVASQKAFTGKIFSSDELSGMRKAKVEDEMGSKIGKGFEVNSNIASGTEVPFMIVFYNTPENLAAFDVEVVDSEDVSKH